MRITPLQRERVVALDRRYRSCWDTRTIGHVTGVGHVTVAKILREERGPRPKPVERPHERRTLFLRRDVMWSTDYQKLEGGVELLKTIEECSRYRPGWEVLVGESAEEVVMHADDLLEMMGRAPLVWKHDNGGPFKSGEFQEFLEENDIISYPTRPRAPWTNGRVERDNQDVQGWLLPMMGKGLKYSDWNREVDEGMLMLNYVKPRAVLGYRTSADVYFHTEGIEDIDRGMLLMELEGIKCQLGWDGWHKDNALHRRAVKLLLRKWGLYEEWSESDAEAGSVNEASSDDVAF